MGRLRKIARRTFLIGTGTIAGGLLVGWVAYKWPIANPLLDGLAAGDATLNPYVLIDADGVTIIVPRADVGQGVYSSLAALVAEELDLAWGAFRVDHGPPSAAYFNGKVAAEGFPIAATSDTFFAERGRDMGRVLAKLMGLQITGGSSSTADAFDKMRVAGAAARQMLLAAASRRTGIAIGKLQTRDGAVILPDGKALAYPTLAAAASRLDPPGDVALKPPSQWRLLGKPMQRLDIPSKVTGAATYGIDLRLPGMLHATVRSNPRRGAMSGCDTRAAEGARGVRKVVRVTNGIGVVADNTWRAFRAAALLEPQWGPAPYPATSAAQFTAAANAFKDAFRDSRLKDEGDVESALAEHGNSPSLQAEYRIPYLAHAPLEPMNAVAQLRDGQLDIWTSTQIPRFVVKSAAAVAGIEESKVRLHVLIGGGSFGRRLEDDFIRQAVELAKAVEGVPVKMTWTREEDMSHDFPRPLAIARARGAVRNGAVHAYDLAIAAQSVTTSQMGRLGQSLPGPDTAIVAGAWDQPFAIPHYRVSGYRVPELVPVSSWRSVGASGNGFLHECFLDELIHAAGADPLAERLRLCTHAPSKRVLQAVGEIAGWGTPLPQGRGRGLAFVLSFGVPVAEVVEVTATDAGIRIDKVFVAAEVGKVVDPVNFEAQVQGGVIFGLGHAMNCELTFADGVAQQTNFHAYEGMRLYQAPQIVVRALETTGEVRGIGEPPVPPAAPALANAIFAATGQRIRELPLHKSVRFA